MYARGHPEDYNYWAKFTGDNRWNYENVLPYFKKSENFQCVEELDAETSKYHAKNGPLTVRYADFKGMAEYVIKAAKEFGYPTIDYNTDYTQGNVIVFICAAGCIHLLKIFFSEQVLRLFKTRFKLTDLEWERTRHF